MSYYGGTIELESAEWNDKKAVEYELAQAAWGMRLNVWYDLFHWNKNIVCADKRAAINKLASMPDWNGVLYHMDVPDTAAIKTPCGGGTESGGAVPRGVRRHRHPRPQVEDDYVQGMWLTRRTGAFQRQRVPRLQEEPSFRECEGTCGPRQKGA